MKPQAKETVTTFLKLTRVVFQSLKSHIKLNGINIEIYNDLDILLYKYQVRDQEIQALLANKSLIRIKKYKNCIYVGQFHNGIKEGKGILIMESGRVYEGDWLQDTKQGKGIEIYPNGSYYQGQFQQGKRQGRGFYKWPNAEEYDGEWGQGLKHGCGLWRGTRGEQYIGEWQNGNAHGFGIHIWINGDKYEGQFQNCLKHGEGKEIFINGDNYAGEYYEGQPHGYGEYIWKNGEKYRGDWKNGLREGKGLWVSSNQLDKYEGEYINDKKQGQGLYYFANGSIYKGKFYNDDRHGYGEIHFQDGTIEAGEWVKGKLINGKSQYPELIKEQMVQQGTGKINTLAIVQQENERKQNKKLNKSIDINDSKIDYPISAVKTVQEPKYGTIAADNRKQSKSIVEKIKSKPSVSPNKWQSGQPKFVQTQTQLWKKKQGINQTYIQIDDINSF